MNNSQKLIAQGIYEQLLLGHKPQRVPAAELNDISLQMVKFIIEHVLRWTPNEAAEHISDHILNTCGMTNYYINKIKVPSDIKSTENRKWEYILHQIYPHSVPYDQYRQVIEAYKEIELGITDQFPKNMFAGENAADRAAAVLQYYVSAYISYQTVDELYKIFTGKEIKGMLKEAHLYSICRSLYDSSPLDYLHYSLSEDDRDYFLYNFYKFKTAFKSALSYNRKLKRAEKKQPPQVAANLSR